MAVVKCEIFFYNPLNALLKCAIVLLYVFIIIVIRVKYTVEGMAMSNIDFAPGFKAYHS